MPFTQLVKGLGDLPAEVQLGVESLKFRNTVLVYLNVAGNRSLQGSVALRPFARSRHGPGHELPQLGAGALREIAEQHPGPRILVLRRGRPLDAARRGADRTGQDRDPLDRIGRQRQHRSGPRRPHQALLPGLRDRLQEASRSGRPVRPQLRRPDPDRALRLVQVQQPGSQHPHGPAGRREPSREQGARPVGGEHRLQHLPGGGRHHEDGPASCSRPARRPSRRRRRRRRLPSACDRPTACRFART